MPWWVGIGILAFYVLGRDKKHELLMLAHAFAGAVLARFVFTEIIRFFYDRPRPFDAPAEALAKAGVKIVQLIPHAGGGSFPSGHAAFFFALATGVFFYRKWWGVLFYAAALLISFSRVAAGLHWPSDILAGAVIGILSAWLVKILLKNFARGGS